MSNPTVTIDNSIPVPADPQVIRTTFTKIVYDSQKFFIYGEGEFDPTYSTFNPAKKGEEFFMWVPLDNALGAGGVPPGLQPDFVSDEAWGPASSGPNIGDGGLRRSGSGFITAVKSVMPKIIIPSKILVDNGLVTPNDVWMAAYKEGSVWKGLFNWNLVTLNGAAPAGTESFKYASIGAYPGSQYVTVKGKDDKNAKNEMVIKLTNPTVAWPAQPPPQGSDHLWLAGDSSNLVVGGAFVLMLNVVPTRPATADPQDVSKNPWSVTMEFGEVKMKVVDSGSTEVTIGIGSASGELNKTTVNLAEGKTKGGPPQQQHINDKEPFIILVYPVWNGIVIASGIQDARATVLSSSYYVPKLKEAAVLNQPYSNGFDPTAPAPVEVDVGGAYTDPTCVLVDFGNQLTLTAVNCRFDVAYLPCFFSRECWFDEWRLQSDDQDGVVTFTYNVYPIWTANGTATILDPAPSVDDSGVAGTIADTHYAYTKWRLRQDNFDRVGGAIFGSILEVVETRDFPIKNGNGNFDIVFTAADPGDPSPGGWKDYIQSVNVSTTIDGSSGSMTIDKYGVAGQHAVADQSIGAIVITAQGGNGTQNGIIFKGLGMGIADNRTSGGALWTVPLIGLEKKMEDIALINVPFFDGDTLSVVGDFLCKYAGLIPDFTYANPSKQLGISEDVNVVRFDWKAGTTVRAALEEVMADLVHHYVVRDGYVYFYELDEVTGLPVNAGGTDWESTYPNTKVVMYDASPDFEDLRNEIAILGLEQIPDGQNTEIQGLPTFPRVAVRSNITTVPDVPWAKTLVRPIPGYMTMAEFDIYANKQAGMYSVYELIGKTTIPGNANIKPYDTWGDLIIYGVSHNLDFRSKTWTTDLEFMRKTRT